MIYLSLRATDIPSTAHRSVPLGHPARRYGESGDNVALTFKSHEAPEGWTPHVDLDLNTASANAFQEKAAQFKLWADQQTKLVEFDTGWWMLNPFCCEELLKRDERQPQGVVRDRQGIRSSNAGWAVGGDG